VKEKNDNVSITQKLNQNLSAKKGIIGILLGAMVVIIIGAVVLDAFQTKRNDKATVLSEKMVELYADWSVDVDKEDNEEELLALFDEALNDYKGTFAEQRALFTRGQYFIDKEMWEEAAGDFYSLYEGFPKSYLAAVSLYNAASVMEEAGNLDKSFEYFETLVNEYYETAPEAPEALFQLGRLQEKMGDSEKAIEYYEQLILDFSDTEWTNLAKSRIISLNI